MIAVQMRFLAGRFHATPWGRHVNEGVPEWPPSSWRLLRSLIATFYRTHPPNVTEAHLLRVLAALAPPPEFRLPPVVTAHTRHFDRANGGIKFFDTFSAVDPSDAVVWMWPDAHLSDDDRAALAVLLENLGSFGRAESWCEAELVAETGEIPNCRPVFGSEVPRNSEPVRVLTPAFGNATTLFDSLRIETTVMRKRKLLDPPGAQWTTYARPRQVKPEKTRMPRSVSDTELLTIARYALDSTVLPSVRDALPVAELARRSLCKVRRDGSPSRALCGKDERRNPLEENHVHAHFLLTDENEDGRLDHLTVYARCGFDEDDLDALNNLSDLKRGEGRHDAAVVLLGLGTVETFAESPPFRESKVWRSVTPFSLPRFATGGVGRRPRPRDLPVAQLRREFRLRGLSEPSEVRLIDGYEAGSRSMVRWPEFHTRRFNGTEGFGLSGFEIAFDREVAGPFSLGFGCHFGLGLFLPVA